MLSGWFLWFIVLWILFLITMMSIGGFFMFRKFFKRIPKSDGMSELDWQEYYINQTIHLWNDPAKKLLNELVQPIPKWVRDVAKQKIAGKIGQLALEENAKTITEELLIRGYILATPKQDHKFLIKTLKRKNIDPTNYMHYFS